MTFRFPLQGVLDLRVQREQTAASSLAASRRLEADAIARRARLQDALQRELAALARGGAAGEMRNRCLIIDQLEQRVQEAEAAVVEAHRELERQRAQYREAFRNRSTLDGVKDRQEQVFRKEADRAEGDAMDDLAVSQFQYRKFQVER